MKSRPRLLVIAGLICMFAVGYVALAYGLNSSSPDPANPLSVARAADAQTAEDKLPDFFVEHSVESIGLRPETTRLAYFGSGGRAWFAIGGQGDRALNCLITASGTGAEAIYATSCKPPAASGNGLGTYQETDTSPVLVAGLVPDGFDTATYVSAGRSLTASIASNVLVFRVADGEVPESVAISGPTGRKVMKVY